MPRSGLTRERVVAEAAAVADAVGLDRLTLASVAQRLDVSLPGLYKHIRNLESLKRDLAILGVRQLTDAMSAAAVGRAQGDALHAVAEAYRQYAKAHPGLEAASVRAPAPDDAEHIAAGVAAVAVFAAILAGYAVIDADAIDAIRMLRATTHGFVTLELSGGFGLPQSVDATYARLIDALDATFSAWGRRPPARGAHDSLSDGGTGV